MSRIKKYSDAQSSLLSVQEVAMVLGVCRQTVYSYIYREGLPSISVRGIRRIRPESLNKWLEEREQRFV
jgi:excisionase family DNA binding protein